MTPASWEQADTVMLRLSNALLSATVSDPKPTIAPDTDITIYIESTSFLKYVTVSLVCNNQILNFYNNLVMQSTPYNIFLHSFEDITSTEGVIPDTMKYKSQSITVT